MGLLKRILTALAVGAFGLLLPLCVHAQAPYGLGWNDVPNTKFTNICPSTVTFPNINGAEGCRAVNDDWNGGTVDTKRQRLMFWGGGHAGYFGNEVYFFEPFTGTIGRYTDPATPSLCALVWGGTPNVTHNYGSNVYIGDDNDIFFTAMGDLSRGTGNCSTTSLNSATGITAAAWLFKEKLINQATLPNPPGAWTPLDSLNGGAGLTFQVATGCVGTCTNPGWGRFGGGVGGSGVGEFSLSQTDIRTNLVYVSDGVSLYVWDPKNPTVAQELSGEGGNIHWFAGAANGSFLDTDAGTMVVFGNVIRRFHVDALTGTKWNTDNLDSATTGCSARGAGLSIGAAYDYVQHIAVLWGSPSESTQIIHLFNPKDTPVTVSFQALGLSNHTVAAKTCETYTAPQAPGTSTLPSLVPTQTGGTGEWGRFGFLHDVAGQDLYVTLNNKDTDGFVLALNPPVTQVGAVSFASRCATAGVIKCVTYDTAADIPQDTNTNNCAVLGVPTLPCLLPDSNNLYQAHIDPVVSASGGGSVRFDIPASAGQNSSGELTTSLGGRFGPAGSLANLGTTFFIQFRFRMDANAAYLWKQWQPNGEGQKIFAVLNQTVAQGSTCQSEAIVFQNIFYRGFPQAGTNCVNVGLYEGTSPNLKYENGSDYQCLQNQAFAEPACDMQTFHPNEWYTFYCKFVLPQWDASATSGWNTGHNTIQCWTARQGQNMKQFMNFTAFPLQAQNGLGPSGYNAIKFYPYDTSRSGGSTCVVGGPGSANTAPCSAGKIWYDELIVSTQPITAPDGATPGGGGTGPQPPTNLHATPISIPSAGDDLTLLWEPYFAPLVQ